MSDKSKVEEMEEPTNGQASESTELNGDNNESGNSGDGMEELSVEEQLREDLAKEKDKFLRLFAEFGNFKKRTSKERMDLFKPSRIVGVSGCKLMFP